MDIKYNKTNKNSLKGEIFINTRNEHINLVAKDILLNEIIPIKYIDYYIELKKLNKGIPINDEHRLKFINEILMKECVKGTSKLISDMCL